MLEERDNILSDEIDLAEIFKILWENKKIIIGFTTFSAIFSVFYALSLPNIYSSNALLAPTSPEESLQSKIGATSLGGLAGLNIPKDYVKKSTEAIERIKSYDFFIEEFIPNIKYENLVAVKTWDKKTNTLIYNKDLYDNKLNKWVEKNGSSQKPSTQQAYKVYRQILQISEDKLSALVSISIEHKSPYVAQSWVDLIIRNINDYMRKIDKTIAQNSIDYLNEIYLDTSLTEIKDVTARLIENQIQKLTLAEANKDYILKPIVSPIAPERKSKPSRSTICIMITILGFMLSLVISLVHHFLINYLNSKKTY